MQTLTMPAIERAELPLEAIECRECGTVALDGKCLAPECGTAAAQSMPKGAIRDSVIAAPSAFTIRGGVD